MFKEWSKHLTVSLLILIGSVQVGRAEEAKAAAPPPPPKWYDTINVSGFVDAYYSYNNHVPGPMTGNPNGSNTYHNFDMRANDLNLSLAEINIVRPVDDKNKAGFYLGLAFGEAADVIACGGPCAGSAESAYKNIRQAYASILLLPGLQLDFGKYVTQMGAEVIESKDNWNYTRSLLFVEAIPYYHSGARLTYTVNDMLYIQGQVANGWNNVSETNNGKYYGVQLGVTPVKALPIVLNYAVSSEANGTIPGSAIDALSLLDIVVTYNMTDSLSFMANYDTATQKQGVSNGGPDAKWDGYALYGRYAFMSTMAAAVRFEQFNDPNGVRTLYAGGQKLSEETLTLEYSGLGSGSLIRLDIREDKSDQNSFPGETGNSDKQDTVTLGIVQTF